MKYIGNNNQYFETEKINSFNSTIVENTEQGELMLLWFESDNNRFEIDNVDYTFNTNDIVCLTEFNDVKVKELHKARLISWNKYFYCVINHDSEVGCKGILFYGAMALPVIHLSQQDADSVSLVWQMLEQEMISNDSLQEEMLQMTLKRLLILCTRIYKNQTDLRDLDNTNIDIIREYNFLVEQHFKEKHTVAEYAELMYKSPKTLSNIFKKLGSKSPLQFIKDRKMIEARRLLSYTDFTISEVGYNLGFSDVQSFSRFFKREEGVSPVGFKQYNEVGKN